MSTTLHELLGRTIDACPCGARHVIPLERAIIGSGAIDAVASLVAPPERNDGPLLLLADPDTYDAAGARVLRVLEGAGLRTDALIAMDHPHADDVTIAALETRIARAPRGVLAVGAGTIGDIGKTIAGRLRVPLVTVGTAASMNGFASTIAALTLGGLKSTVPAPCPIAVVLDTDVLARAPRTMTAAGFGDLMSKPVSGADWVLSGLLVGERVCPTALALADDAVTRARRAAEAIGRAEPEALGTLAEALVISGLSMAVAGASSPASGGEHLISHYLDMSAQGWARPSRLHGEQVAVATLVSASLYERLRAHGPPAEFDPSPDDESESTLRTMHAHLDARALDAVLAETRAKAEARPTRDERRARLRERWAEIWAVLDRQLAPVEGLRDALRAAGAPTRAAEIDVPATMLEQTLVRARHIRRRFTVLDAAFDTGRLAEWATSIASTV